MPTTSPSASTPVPYCSPNSPRSQHPISFTFKTDSSAPIPVQVAGPERSLNLSLGRGIAQRRRRRKRFHSWLSHPVCLPLFHPPSPHVLKPPGLRDVIFGYPPERIQLARHSPQAPLKAFIFTALVPQARVVALRLFKLVGLFMASLLAMVHRLTLPVSRSTTSAFKTQLGMVSALWTSALPAMP